MTTRRRWIKRVVTWGITLTLVATWFVLFRPSGIGGPAGYVTVSGDSMEPTLSNGDFVITRVQHDYEPGDTIVYRIEDGEVGAGGLVIHRIIGGSIEEGFRTQGDNREQPDLWYPTRRDIVGEVWIAIPSGGRWLSLLRSPIAIAAFAAMLAFTYVMASGREEVAQPAP